VWRQFFFEASKKLFFFFQLFLVNGDLKVFILGKEPKMVEFLPENE
jgi:hypothetical protein